LMYLVALGYRVRLISRATSTRDVHQVSDEDARAIPEHELPMYTLLVPAFHEAESIAQLLDALDRLEYPKSKLEVMLLLEADDDATVAAARKHARPYVEVVLVPPSEPRTKPKALNYGLLAARGELVTIYDVEDLPEPLQLRRVAAVFRELDESYACVQARLVFYNSRQNQITKWFTLDYAIWFDWFLPGLVADADVVPLSGTSNHFRTQLLLDAGAWDPFNVTEDADLGVRLRRLGHSIALIDSDTGEEATSDFVNWVKQRSRSRSRGSWPSRPGCKPRSRRTSTTRRCSASSSATSSASTWE
jgi:cellulose synthase/poly-beta-1,6-N-acetylglucosamine synthase-like glycosyltransferase